MLEETKEKFRNIYTSKRDTIEWMITYGSEIEKIEATIIKKVALDIKEGSI